MTAIAPTLQAFFTDRLMTQRRASPHTIASYRDTMRLLLGYAQQRTGPADRLPYPEFLQDLRELFGRVVDGFKGSSQQCR